MNKRYLKEAFIRTIPVMSGYIVLGMGYGILMAKSGFGLPWVLSYGLLTYAGSMQFVAINLMTSAASLVTTFLTTIMVNARHFLYGISMLSHYKESGIYKPYLVFSLTDETYSLVVTWDFPEGVSPYQFSFLMSLLDQCYWVLGGLIGAIIGSLITFNTAGLEFSMTALFVSVAVEQWCTTSKHHSALIGLFGSIICLLIFGSGQFLIPAMVLIVAGLTLIRGKTESGGGHDA